MLFKLKSDFLKLDYEKFSVKYRVSKSLISFLIFYLYYQRALGEWTFMTNCAVNFSYTNIGNIVY
jgi:hypothetical protein